ncbi:hypothetical protein M231_03892 [Tremella mesenterica]|uniref:ZSWIM1/3 RNaseH-like domain-containing protein n=1 Tax=Tremella mesenterica TaxID=5217 RepID=A0A4Q1BM02_TREME|nr:hypothetical protein M231_03892 [Tremella mesenterica]
MEAARLHTQQVAMGHTVCIVTKRSIKDKGRLELQCVHGGDGRSHRTSDFEEVRKRPRTTKQSNCPFSIIWRRETKKIAQQANRAPLWIPYTIENSHNHEPLPLLYYSFIRQASRSPEVLQFIRHLLESEHTLRSVVLAVQLHFGDKVSLTRKDVENIRFSHEKALRQGLSATEAAITRLTDNNDLFKAFTNSKKELCGLVFTTPSARAMTHSYPTVLFMDCTYRTNRYRLPMLHIAGCTATNQTYTSAIAFLSREVTEGTPWPSRPISNSLGLSTMISKLSYVIVKSLYTTLCLSTYLMSTLIIVGGTFAKTSRSTVENIFRPFIKRNGWRSYLNLVIIFRTISVKQSLKSH